jgi:peroxiredoxin
MPLIDLEQQLAAFRQDFPNRAPADRVALYERNIEELRATFAAKRALAAGELAPDFSLPDPHGRVVSLWEVLRRGPAVVAFYRGGWCPYCNLQLRAYQAMLPELASLGASLVAISPQLPDGSLSTSETNALTFDVLSDVGNTVARSFGLVYALSQELRDTLHALGKALPGINGDDSWQLPVPATYVIAPDRRVSLAFIDVDYRRRLGPQEILASLRTLREAGDGR